MPVVPLEGDAVVGSVAVGCVDVLGVDPEPVPVPLLPLSNSGLRDWPAGGRRSVSQQVLQQNYIHLKDNATVATDSTSA